ncbi:hypothetical protein 2016_scaffold57_00147 [Bacteriophage sp.]|nr:hypothetical protein 2016_scaffold57_00147 [Bacteriophage sp.]
MSVRKFGNVLCWKRFLMPLFPSRRSILLCMALLRSSSSFRAFSSACLRSYSCQ